MKSTKILYWVFTVLFAIAMIFSSYASILNDPQAVDLIHDKMGYPLYFIPYTGWMKVLGVIAILIPGFPRIKEWAYAGLFFDLIAVCYSFYSLKFPTGTWAPMMLIWFGLGIASYIFYHKLLRQRTLAIAR
jgi:uncharacterized membrane protein YphA (DoxX/SURF4 family)